MEREQTKAQTRTSRSKSKPADRPAKPQGKSRRAGPAQHDQAGNGAGLFSKDLGTNPANFAPLTPLSFLQRAADIHPNRTAVIHGAQRCSYRELYARTRRLASALEKAGVRAGDTVSVMLPNIPAMVEAHYGVPMLGAVLNTINTRLEAATIAYILQHAEAKVLITDREFAAQVGPALARLEKRPLVIDVVDSLYTGLGEALGKVEYEEFIAEGDPHFDWTPPTNESSAIALNYTSGTTGDPKGVVYHHRGAYLNAICNIVTWSMP